MEATKAMIEELEKKMQRQIRDIEEKTRQHEMKINGTNQQIEQLSNQVLDQILHPKTKESSPMYTERTEPQNTNIME
jgi:polyhydroxyalkanoate synthesis regulator phasin